MRVSGRTRVLGLIGDPVEHTLSPVIHNTLSALTEGSREAVYVPFHVSREGLEAAVRGAFELGIQGLNVTVPHKSAVIPYLDGIDDMAKAIGAVNTLVRTEKGYYGYNTDAEGLIRELDYYGIDVKDRDVVLLGAGGAARAAAFAVQKCGAKNIFIFNRTKEKAEEIAGGVNALGGETAFAHSMDELEVLYDREYYVIQCTSVGLYPDVESCVVEDGEFFDHAVCGVDLVYKPGVTEFMKRLRKRGKSAYNGLRMLLFQAVAAYEKFMDVKPDRYACERAAFKLMYAEKPIVLTGYMGSGKSSVGRILSEMLGCEFIDSDEEIVRKEGRSINDIFAKDGEEAFRDMETAFLQSLKGRSGTYVLSTGGGIVLREENRRLMREDLGALVIYLTATPVSICKRLSTDGTRPLLAGGGESLMEKVISMLAQRRALYEEAACITINTDHLSVYDVAREIKDLEI